MRKAIWAQNRNSAKTLMLLTASPSSPLLLCCLYGIQPGHGLVPALVAPGHPAQPGHGLMPGKGTGRSEQLTR